ncbi:hypothetical protein Tco_0474724 [Tanacetum coccineum]
MRMSCSYFKSLGYSLLFLSFLPLSVILVGVILAKNLLVAAVIWRVDVVNTTSLIPVVRCWDIPQDSITTCYWHRSDPGRRRLSGTRGWRWGFIWVGYWAPTSIKAGSVASAGLGAGYENAERVLGCARGGQYGGEYMWSAGLAGVAKHAFSGGKLRQGRGLRGQRLGCRLAIFDVRGKGAGAAGRADAGLLMWFFCLAPLIGSLPGHIEGSV